MSSNNRAKRELKKATSQGIPFESMPTDIQQYHNSKIKPVEPLNDRQSMFMDALLHERLVIGAGAAGTGKTFTATAIAADLYRHGHVKKIIMTRPTVEVGRSLGYLPGTMDEKFLPYLEPFEDTLKSRLGEKYQADLHKKIRPLPIQYMRGHTFDDAVVLVDEAQNLTVTEVKAIITRIGHNCRLFLTGDTSQSDVSRQHNGLKWLIDEIKRQEKTYEIIEFEKRDCVRDELCMDMIDLIEKSEQ